MVVVTFWLISWRWFFQMLLIKTHYYENKRKRIFDTYFFSLSHDDVDCLSCLRSFDSNCTFYFYFRDVKTCCIFSVLNFNKLVLIKKQGNLKRHTCWRICHWWLEKLCIAVFGKDAFFKIGFKTCSCTLQVKVTTLTTTTAATTSTVLIALLTNVHQ